ncbi:alpha/beta hydrolase family protein [Sinomicrobium weinanense]|uniref:Alpha/beta hydrolase n=1 Tax=Sinomicrobium weinanense TaxID=2842200 RepID=A0A926JVB2_9FLAO|nr:alpha/beta hydrolase [Sinomicrobium weinanense]MBC9798238.1 alpha/beta hydrolase [Sinomicrobium weinanense]MBU3123258.1 alpha/beta hydrolase [Sinomicrobium weinanense]
MAKKFYLITIAFLVLLPIARRERKKSSILLNPVSENITFKNSKDNITFSGTLALPGKEGRFPAVILISGNGKNNRNSEFGNHKPFLDISNHFIKNNIAVLRYDKRGVGKSEGNFDAANSFDFAEDVKAALNYLLTRQDIQKNNIGLVGHSEGGLIAPIVAATSENVAYIVSLAGPSIPGNRILLSQQKALAEVRGIGKDKIKRSQKINREAFEIVNRYTNDSILKVKMLAYIRDISQGDPDKPKDITFDEYVNAQVKNILRPWMVNFLRYNPQEYIKQVTCPVLALNGSKDLQVLAKENLPRWKAILEKSGNKNVTIKEISNLNHQFQTCKTGLPEEYEKLNESFSPIVMEEMVKWIKKHLK